MMVLQKIKIALKITMSLLSKAIIKNQTIIEVDIILISEEDIILISEADITLILEVDITSILIPNQDKYLKIKKHLEKVDQ